MCHVLTDDQFEHEDVGQSTKKKYSSTKCLSLAIVKTNLPACSLVPVVSMLFSSLRIHAHFLHSRCTAAIVTFF